MIQYDSFAPLEMSKDIKLWYVRIAVRHIAQVIFPRA